MLSKLDQNLLEAASNSTYQVKETGDCSYLYSEKGKGSTATILAALYMKETGVKADVAIDFVGKNYMVSAIQTKVLVQFEKLLNPVSLDEEIKTHKASLIAASNIHHPAVQASVKNLANELKQNNIPKKLANEVLKRSNALLKPESNEAESRKITQS